MSNQSLLKHQPHTHHFTVMHKENEHSILLVVILTLITMIAEITAGTLTGSMALLSDGWHMGTHVGALGIALFAYSYSRRNADTRRYSFGTGKVGILGAFASAMILGMTGILIMYESLSRLFNPVTIDFNMALLVAVVGLIVNMSCAWILHGSEEHHHHGNHAHHNENHEDGDDSPHQTDQNYRAAFLHILADAMTSVLAITALLFGKHFGMVWFDPAVGLLGAGLILWWSYGLIRQTGRVLLDSDVSTEELDKVRAVIEADSGNTVLDIHVWRVGENALAAIISLFTEVPKPPEYYHELLRRFDTVKHVTIEVHSPNCFGQRV